MLHISISEFQKRQGRSVVTAPVQCTVVVGTQPAQDPAAALTPIPPPCWDGQHSPPILYHLCPAQAPHFPICPN